MMKGHKTWVLLVAAFFYLNSEGQEFSWRSELDTVPESGFYRIPLSIDWLVHLKNDLSDIRIKDEKNRVVPFIIKKYPAEKNSLFINFPILKNTTDSIATTLELDAGGQQGTDHLYLVIGNNAVERHASLSGSNDQHQWFIIDERLPLTNRTGYGDDRFIQWLSFPFIRYRYLKLKINNKGTDPLPVLKTGIYIDTAAKEFFELYLHSGTTHIQKDSSDGNTYVSVHSQQPYPVDRISIVLSGPKFYKRTINVYNTEGGKKNLLSVTEVRSGKDPAIWVMAGKAQNLLLVIENGDNPPLKVNAVNTQCRKQELISYLEKGEKYVLVGGNATAVFPNYDLAVFRDSIPPQTATLTHAPVIANAQENVLPSPDKHWWIWPAIIAMITALSILTYRLLAEMKTQKQN